MKQSSPAELAELAHAVFVVDARGRELLEYLERKYCTQAAVVTSGGIDAILTTYQRAAHREVLDHLHSMIARHELPPSDTPLATTA